MTRSKLKLWVFEPSHRVVEAIYLCHRLYERGGVSRKLSGVLWQWMVSAANNISPYARLGSGLALPHPVGIVIGAEAEVGEGVLIYQNVTLGRRTAGEPGAPTILDHCVIYAGAVVIGNITVGPNATIGANSVVTCDVPPGCTAVGNPARIINKNAGETSTNNGAYQDGKKAFMFGLPYYQNPWPAGSDDQCSWNRGYADSYYELRDTRKNAGETHL